MLETKELTKIYKPKRGVPVEALKGVSLKFPDKGMVFLIGKSGSGKSTLLNLLGGLDRYDGGEIIIKGVSSKSFKQTSFDSYRNTYVGFIFQEYNILEEFNVGANIALALELQGKRATDEEINRILAEVDLTGYGNRKPNELSGGQLQRVAIARALVKNPEIIMADEPTGALDSRTGTQVLDTLKRLSETKLVIVVSHDIDYAQCYADRIIELSDGRVICDI
ncbi:MAG: ABC transporter ATP-binding protein [Firmicutes bacterium]|nr:ABC transporter ATP-binding protein [Bacillota bacterium]